MMWNEDPSEGDSMWILARSIPAVLVVLTAPTWAAELLGRVIEHGKPKANVEVTLKGGTPDVTLTRRTDAAGNFAFTGVVPGSYKLSCTGPGKAIEVRPGANGQDCSL
jgi:hypothetical protein